MNALEIHGLVKRYPRGWLGGPAPHAAVDGVDLVVKQGEVLGLIGESGSGKSTLARAALGLLPFDAGTAAVLGVEMARLSSGDRRRFRRRVQLLFQNADAHLNPGLRVGQILAESARLHRPGASGLVTEALAAIGLVGREQAFPHELSGGEKRRVGIAQLWIANPELTVADEPTAGLDASQKAEILDLLLARKDGRRAWLLISHDLPQVASVADRVAVMQAGRIVEEFPVSALRSGPHHALTWELLVSAGMGAAP